MQNICSVLLEALVPRMHSQWSNQVCQHLQAAVPTSVNTIILPGVDCNYLKTRIVVKHRLLKHEQIESLLATINAPSANRLRDHENKSVDKRMKLPMVRGGRSHQSQ